MRFPLFIELDDRPCLVVGGGAVAVRKATALAEYGAKVTMVAGKNAPRGAGISSVRVICRCFVDSDVEGMALVVSATDDRTVNGHVAAVCRTKGIPVNVVDDPANCTFIFPAVVRKGPIIAAVSTGGACPVAAKLVRDKVGRLLTDEFIAAVEQLGTRREEMKRTHPDPHERMLACEEALSKWKDRLGCCGGEDQSRRVPPLFPRTGLAHGAALNVRLWYNTQ